MRFGDIFREIRKKRKDSQKNDVTVNESNEQIKDNTLSPVQAEVKKENIIEREEDMRGYYNHCHNYVYHVKATQWLLRHDLYYEIIKLQIGFDVDEEAIIIPIDKNHYAKYSIRE